MGSVLSDAGAARGEMVAGWRDAVLGAQNVEAEGLDGVQPLDLDQTGQQVRDAVSRRTDAVEELHAVRHASDLVPLQPEALGQVSPRLHHCLICAVGGAEHAAGALQTVEGQLGRTQTCRDEEHHHHQRKLGSGFTDRAKVKPGLGNSSIRTLKGTVHPKPIYSASSRSKPV